MNMNDMYNRNMPNYRSGDWISPAPEICPNCQRYPMADYQNGAGMNAPTPTGIPQAAAGSQANLVQRGFPTQNMITTGVSPEQAVQSVAADNMQSPSPALLAQNQPTTGGFVGPGAMTPSISPAVASSFPSGGQQELSGLTAININNQPTAVNLESLQYLNGFLLTQIGKQCKVEFLIGSNITEDRTGTLVGVGANYILLNEFPTNNVVACDFYSIKFINFYYY